MSDSLALNTISIDEALAAIGPCRTLEIVLTNLFGWSDNKGNRSPVDVQTFPFVHPPQIRPSIVVRGEAELFGLSMPRFAIRLYLEDGAFINCRRLNTLKVNAQRDGVIERCHRRSLAQEEKNDVVEILDADPPLIADLLGEHDSCIADSLLAPPEMMHRQLHLHIIDCRSLLKHYGGTWFPRDGRSILRQFGHPSHPHSPYDLAPIFRHTFPEPKEQGPRLPPLSPYVHGFGFGAGYCAQAVLYLATAMLLKFASRICGLAEITALTHSPKIRELLVAGLTPENMRSYFHDVGLRVTEEAAIFPEWRDKGIQHPEETLHMAARAYLQSGMPIIVPTDMQKLAYARESWNERQPTYVRNKVDFPAEMPNTPHVIILVGCTTRGTIVKDKGGEFIFHDPSTRPYLTVRGHELLHLGPPIAPREIYSYEGVLMPVVPGRVQLSLLLKRKFLDERGVYVLGLIYFVSRLNEIAGDFEDLVKTRTPIDEWPEILRPEPIQEILMIRHSHAGEPHELAPFCLFNFAYGPLRESDLEGVETDSKKRQAFTVFLNRIFKGAGDYWFWLEFAPGHVWMWDAELPGLELSEVEDEVPAIIRRLLAVAHGDTWTPIAGRGQES
jgi:hypothetical protein